MKELFSDKQNNCALTRGLNYDVQFKDSGVDWIGEVPSHWKIVDARELFAIRKSYGNDTEVLLAATQKYGMCPQDEIDGVVQVKLDTDLQTFKTVHKNDFVISLRSFQGGFEISDYEGVCSPAYQVFFAIKDISHKYFKYLFKSERFISKINSLTVGIRDGKNIVFGDFAKSVQIPFPPLNEQQAIAERYMKIEQLLALKQHLIAEMHKTKSR
jgi:type I restriction enzyme S subunit